MPKASIIVPAYNAEATIGETLESLLAQTFKDFELLIIDDGSRDGTLDIVARYVDARIRVIQQANRGLAGAHNTGIAQSRGEYVGFCDADDLWLSTKLARHVEHLDARPEVGISFSGSMIIDMEGNPTGLAQAPKLSDISARDVFLRNPIGNGSAAVIRRSALDDLAYRPAGETQGDWWFDETFRQSDDIEGWTRFALTTDWRIEGIPGQLTCYRINRNGLSANVIQQHQSWERMLAKMADIAPDFVTRYGPRARAYQYRYLCRRAVSMRDGGLAVELACKSMGSSLRPFISEPVKSLSTVCAALALSVAGAVAYDRAESALLLRLRRIT